MGTMVRMKNVGRGEAIFRSVIGVILIIIPFFISGVFRWAAGKAASERTLRICS